MGNHNTAHTWQMSAWENNTTAIFEALSMWINARRFRSIRAIWAGANPEIANSSATVDLMGIAKQIACSSQNIPCYCKERKHAHSAQQQILGSDPGKHAVWILWMSPCTLLFVHMYIIGLCTIFTDVQNVSRHIFQHFTCEIFMASNLVFLRRPQNISSHFCGHQNRYFKPNHDVFLNLTKWFLSLTLTRA